MNKYAVAGYTLVEIAISLVVLGLLLGGALVPLQHRFEVEDRREVDKLLADSTEAVIGYAIANRTVMRTVVDASGIIHPLPAGRPYLPCPDISGDGIENRNTVIIALTTSISLAATASTVLIDQGTCAQSKGLLPWRTLGLRIQGDPWGRRIGYRVDPVFASQISGFDETFRADTFDPRLVLTVGVGGETIYQTRISRNESGGLVCSEFTDALGCPQLVDGFPNLLAGVITTMNMNLGARNISAHISNLGTDPPSGILDGASFVIYSHGRNGWGGISSGGVCVPFLGNVNIGEVANAFYRADHPFLMPPFNCTFPTPASGNLAENIFISAPENPNSDDILVWTSSNALVGALLQAGALPIPKLGFLPE